MSSIEPAVGRRLAALVSLLATLLVACTGPIGATPRATAADFEGLLGAFSRAGLTVSDIRSGDPGCPDPSLAGTAISFSARGSDQAAPVRVHLFVFRNADAYDRRRADVDRCALQVVADPGDLEAVDASPFVALGAGPWGPAFRALIRTVLLANTGSSARETPAPGAS